MKYKFYDILHQYVTLHKEKDQWLTFFFFLNLKFELLSDDYTENMNIGFHFSLKKKKKKSSLLFFSSNSNPSMALSIFCQVKKGT